MFTHAGPFVFFHWVIGPLGHWVVRGSPDRRWAYQQSFTVTPVAAPDKPRRPTLSRV